MILTESMNSAIEMTHEVAALHVGERYRVLTAITRARATRFIILA